MQLTWDEITQADVARKWTVDASTIIGIRRTVEDAVLVALAARPRRPAKERDWPLEGVRSEIASLTGAIKAMAVVRGRTGWG